MTELLHKEAVNMLRHSSCGCIVGARNLHAYVECYWKKSRLSKVGTTLKFVTSKELSKGVLKSYLPDPSVLSDFLEEGKTRNVKNVQLIKYQPNYTRDVVGLISMHQLCLLYKEEDCEKFLVKAGSSFTKTTLAEIEKLTRDQSTN
ncbi:hypothetical protein EVAR_103724_1 [Eumeta japonica]|uniref:Uncharacterized protein n=1 Tax=Eumeta variegata TaxID=151549 RepID=A0A4C1ZGI9_EUMVA|nr:hypothetical protein EVAR_103724_1 [Eumeta japonica]